MFAFAKQASDKFNSFATAVLPFVFVAKHDPHDQVKEQFQETWNESVGGSRAVNLYLEEILKLCATHLDSPQWALKHTAARAVADAVVVISASDGEMSAATGSSMWPAIEKALSGKTWDGKEVVLSAFVKFVEAAKPFYVQQKDVRDAIVKVWASISLRRGGYEANVRFRFQFVKRNVRIQPIDSIRSKRWLVLLEPVQMWI